MNLSATTGSSPANAGSLSLARLWFQFGGSAAAWIALGVGDMLISWRGCVKEEQFGGPSSHPGAFVLFFVTTGSLFAVTALVGVLSYRSWQKLSAATKLLNAEGRERNEFMSLAGLFISVTLGAGIVWCCIPLFLFQMCARWR